jgi:serine protease Do
MNALTLSRSVAGLLITGLLAPGGLQSSTPPQTMPTPDIRRDATVAAVERVLPSVVNIRTEVVVQHRDPFEEFFSQWFGPFHRRQRPNTPFSLGSGVIVDETGYVMTNLHVVRRATQIYVVLWDGREYQAERYYGTARSDVALLKLRTEPGERFTAIQFAEDDDILLGETVIALGNPFGLGGTVSRGILSSKSRVAPQEHEKLTMGNWLQTDTPINPGNSGGPLVNLRGELIGLNVAILQDAQGIGFAIPARQLREAMGELISPETFSSRWFGARIRPGDLPLRVSWVQPGSPAEKAGLRVDDRILQVNGHAPRDLFQFAEKITEREDLVELQVQSGSEPRRVSVDLVSFFDLIRQRLGADVQDLTPELARNFGLAPHSGILVAGLEKGGPGEQAELQPGVVITAINHDRINDLLNAATVLSHAKPGDAVRLTVLVPRRRGHQIVGYQQGVTTAKIR